LFSHFLPISSASHTSDLLSHLVTALHITSGRSLHQVDPDTILQQSTLVISFPWCYYSMGFVPYSHAMCLGDMFSLFTIQTDASFLVGREGNRSQEQKAVDELDQLLQQYATRSKLVLLEPFMIPGGGRLFSAEFLLQVQQVCKVHQVPLVADETLSFVRSGYSLFSTSVKGFLPDFILLGKSLGCSLLLSNSLLPHYAVLSSSMSNTFSNNGIGSSLLQAVCTLDIFREQQMADHCRVEGISLLKEIQQVVGEKNARGIGYCIWVDNNLEQLPILSAVHGRLLPRMDQDHGTIGDIMSRYRSMVDQFKQWGVNAIQEARIASCAHCGDQCRCRGGDGDEEDDEECQECEYCTRQYHLKCERACPCQVNGN
jgi:hypothetical protein